MADEKRQLAQIATVLDDTEKLLDKLFANVAEIKAMLGRSPAAAPDPKGARS